MGSLFSKATAAVTAVVASEAESERTLRRQQSRQQREDEVDDRSGGGEKVVVESDCGADGADVSDILELTDEFSGVSDTVQHTVWLEILRFSQRDVLEVVEELEELQCLANLVDAERTSSGFRQKIQSILKREKDATARREWELPRFRSIFGSYRAELVHSFEPDPNPLLLLDISDDPTELWYEWGADKASFDSVEEFKKFCQVCGVDPSTCISEKRMAQCFKYHWMSPDKKLIFSCSQDPREYFTDYDGDRRSGDAHYFGFSGLRSRAKAAEQWFHDNANWEEMCFGGRDFC